MSLLTMVLIVLAVEILAGVFLTLRPREILHFQIVSGWVFNWKSRPVTIEQELQSLRFIGIVLILTGFIAVICVTNVDVIVQVLK